MLPFLLFSIFWGYDIWGLAGPRQLLKTATTHPSVHFSHANQSIQSSCSTHLFYGVLYSRPYYPPALTTPGVRYWTARDSPMPQSLMKLFKIGIHKPASPASPVSSGETTMKALAQNSPFPLSAHNQRWCFLVWVPPLPWRALSLLLGAVSNKLFFQWQSSPDLLSLVYLRFSMNTLYFKAGA